MAVTRCIIPAAGFGTRFLPATKSMPEMWTQKWVGGVIELVAGMMIMVGLFTRPAAFLASGMMAVAYIQFHWKGGLGADFLPLVNKGELAVLYCFVFLYFVFAGPGAWSVDGAIARNRGRSA